MGKVLVRINKLAGTRDANAYKWLREGYEPVAVVEGCYVLFDVR
jgi:hypothetical protein